MSKKKQLLDHLPEYKGKSLEEIADLTKLAPSTVLGYLREIGTQFASFGDGKLWVDIDYKDTIVEGSREPKRQYPHGESPLSLKGLITSDDRKGRLGVIGGKYSAELLEWMDTMTMFGEINDEKELRCRIEKGDLPRGEKLG